ncbi:putative Fungal-specific transcription factor domain-containing protein [Seiridium unicorne]|uniref:Fungal-specific transcription factor domain-containing protein n=1 Tax=Seiridium unicorne TaxID=138068 RepID=A0ABR2UFG6_9PEZI
MSINTYAMSSPAMILNGLPLAPTILNTHLIHIFVKIISRFKASLDGNPDFSGPYHQIYPLLIQTSIYTAACLLSENKHLEKQHSVFIKGQAIHMLNERLRSAGEATSDVAIAAVCQLIIDEWPSADFGIAISFETQPYLQEGDDSQFEDSNSSTFEIAHSSPLVAATTSFASCAELYGLHAAAAAILDDVRFLIVLTISLPVDPDAQQEQKLESTARWIHDRINSLPEESPHISETSLSCSQGRSLACRTASSANGVSNSPTADGISQTSDKVQPDYVYQSIRQAALIYTSAIAARKPFSETCSLNDFYRLWATIWRVSLTVWRSMMGVFVWIEVCIMAPAMDVPHGRLVKSMFTVAALNMGIENWTAASNALKGAVMLQAKLGRRSLKTVV